MKNILRKTPLWLISGILIFPVLGFTGLMLSWIFSNEDLLLFWMIVPSILFEEIFEAKYSGLADNLTLNLIFILLFWFVIGGLAGFLLRHLIGSKSSTQP